MIVAVATRLNTDDDPPELDQATVYPFKGVIQPKKVLSLAEQMG